MLRVACCGDTIVFPPKGIANLMSHLDRVKQVRQPPATSALRELKAKNRGQRGFLTQACSGGRLPMTVSARALAGAHGSSGPPCNDVNPRTSVCLSAVATRK